jgi:hypothetical protein
MSPLLILMSLCWQCRVCPTFNSAYNKKMLNRKLSICFIRISYINSLGDEEILIIFNYRTTKLKLRYD